MTTVHREHNLPDVMVHGDMWANNLLFVKEDGQLMDNLAAVIDWQVA